MGFWVYMLASKPGGTLYVGVTNDLIRRVYEHRNGIVPGFTRRYRVKTLVRFEQYDDPMIAVQREKNIKHWPREWKSILSFPQIQNGAISMRSRFDETDGCPGQPGHDEINGCH